VYCVAKTCRSLECTVNHNNEEKLRFKWIWCTNTWKGELFSAVFLEVILYDQDILIVLSQIRYQPHMYYKLYNYTCLDFDSIFIVYFG